MREVVGSGVAVVTGGSSGMGREVVSCLLRDGYRVGILDVKPPVARENDPASEDGQDGTRLKYVECDISDEGQVAQAIDAVHQGLGLISVLVNSAGILRPTRFADIPYLEWRKVFDVNLHGTFLCMQAVVADMREVGAGRIVNFSSTAGKSVSTLGGAHYTASKAAVLGLTRAAANELASDGVTVNAVCPGLIDTEMVRASISPEQIAAYEASFPVSRLGEAMEVAELVTFLASREAAYITGASVDINGGDLMI